MSKNNTDIDLINFDYTLPSITHSVNENYQKKKSFLYKMNNVTNTIYV